MNVHKLSALSITFNSKVFQYSLLSMVFSKTSSVVVSSNVFATSVVDIVSPVVLFTSVETAVTVAGVSESNTFFVKLTGFSALVFTVSSYLKDVDPLFAVVAETVIVFTEFADSIIVV
jgi:hypothetical protein